MTVVSRLRCDAALWSLPPVVEPGQKQARPAAEVRQGPDQPGQAARGQNRGWQTGVFALYGRPVVKTYKTFLATYTPVGGVIRVVLVREHDGWVAYFCDRPGPERGDDPGGGGRPRRRWNRSSTTSRRCMGRASSSCGTCGPTWGRAT